MPSCAAIPPAQRARRGSTLVIAFAALVLIGALLALSSDRVLGTSRLQDLSAAKQRALYAAETVAALKETELVNLAASNDLAGLETKPDPNHGTHWVGGCLVRWRVEPVKVLAAPEDGSGAFAVNPGLGATPAGAVPNTEFYTYRIATEAVALRDPDASIGLLAADKDDPRAPWNDPDRRLVSLQTSRLIQVRMISLFKYAVFYAAEGPDGDIEWFPGGSNTVRVSGAVHTNGALYLSNNGGIRIGGTGSGLGEPVSITAVGGIYRIFKMVMTGNGITDPLSIPPDHPDTALNSRHAPDDRFRFNDVSAVAPFDHCLTRFNDTRSHLPQYQGIPGVVPNGLEATFGDFVKDGVTLGAKVVKTLANIPTLAGRPFEAHALAPSGAQLAVRNPAVALDNPANWTIAPSTDANQLCYSVLVPTGPAHVATRGALEAAHGAALDQLWYGNGGTVTTRSALETAHGCPVTELYYDAAGNVATKAALEAAHGVAIGDLYYDGAGGIQTRAALEATYSVPTPKNIFHIMSEQVGIRPVRAVSAVRTVPAGGMTIHHQDLNGNGTLEAAERLQEGDVALPNATVDSQGFSIWEKTGLYFNLARNGEGNGRFGLLVRERPVQDAAIAAGLPSASRPDPMAVAYTGNPGPYEESAGAIVMQAEGYDRTLSVTQSTVQVTDAGGVDRTHAVGWRPYEAVAGAQPWTGAGVPTAYAYAPALIAFPDRFGAFHADLRAPTLAPHLAYRVRFATAGTWTVWIRGRSNHATSNEVHLSLDMPDQTDPASAALAMLTVPASPGDGLGGWGGAFAWRKSFATATGTAVTFTLTDADIAAQPERILRVWMKEDGAIIDKIVLTTAVIASPISAADAASLDAAAVTLPALPVPARDLEDDLATYCRSQWSVALGATDVTDQFFAHGLGAATSLAGLMAHEQDIMNRREAHYVALFAGGDELTYQVNVLTLNLDRVQDWLRNVDGSTIVAGATGKISERFNGLIYLHRTRRGGGPNPVLTPQFAEDNWLTNWNGFTLPAPLPGNRIGNVPDLLFHSGFRVAGGAAIDWGGREPADNNRIKGLSIVTPQQCYIHGDFNIVPDPAVSDPAVLPATLDVATMQATLRTLSAADAQKLRFPPSAIFADSQIALSNAWRDAGQQRNLYTSATTRSGTLTPARETWYHHSTILNNMPTDSLNVANNGQGSGGTHNVVRFLENWGGGPVWHNRGSLVVLGRMKHSRGRLGSSDYYFPPTRDNRFDTDLFTRTGQPPFTPFGVTITRSLSAVNQSTQ